MEWIISSTVLMLIVIGLRTVLKGRISLGLQYALWLLVLVRLLLPVNLTQSALSILGTAQRVMETAPMQTVTELADTHPEVRSYAEARAEIVARYEAQGTPVNTLSKQEMREFEQQVEAHREADYTLGDVAARVLGMAWIAGMAVTALCLLGSNLRFARRLRRSRRALPVPGCPLPVYATGAVDTPCLFGPVKPAIYLPADIPWDEGAMEHILTHERTHYRHGDHIWSVLRCVCLAVHWYNPLVWICAGLSRRDGELACDEASIRVLGEERRTEYGRTLIDMTCQKPRGMVGLAATTMNDSQKSLRERIRLIARHPKTAAYTLILVILVAALAVGCTFTGLPDETQPPTEPTSESLPQQTDPPTTPPTDPPTEPYTGPASERLLEYQALFDWDGALICNRAAGYPYSRPEDVDLYWLFYGGVDYPGSWDSISQADRDLLVRAGFWTDLDIQIMPAALVEEVLQKYFAVGLEDVTIPEEWVYSPETDTYYSNHNDAYINVVTVIGYDDLADGTVRLRLLVDAVHEGHGEDMQWYSNATMLMTLRPTEDGGYQIISNEYSWLELGTVSVWRDPEQITVYPFTDYAMDSAIRLAENTAGALGAETGVLSFQIENIGFDPMSTDQAVLSELYGGNPTGMSLEDLYARRICLAVTYSATYDHSVSPMEDVEHGQMLVTLARPVDTGVWYCVSSTIHPGSDYPARLLREEEAQALAYLGGEIVAAYRADDGVYDYWVFVKHPDTGEIICIRE